MKTDFIHRTEMQNLVAQKGSVLVYVNERTQAGTSCSVCVISNNEEVEELMELVDEARDNKTLIDCEIFN